jgi:hypothetical protein
MRKTTIYTNLIVRENTVKDYYNTTNYILKLVSVGQILGCMVNNDSRIMFRHRSMISQAIYSAETDA